MLPFPYTYLCFKAPLLIDISLQENMFSFLQSFLIISEDNARSREHAAICRVHGDYTVASGRARIESLRDVGIESTEIGEHIPSEVAAEILASDFQLYSVWRSVREKPVEQFPMGFIDVASCEMSDVVDYEMKFSNRTGFNSGAKAIAAGRHQWYFYPSMTKEECVIFKTWDSSSRKFPFCLHSAMVLDDTPPDADARESIEVRVIAWTPKTPKPPARSGQIGDSVSGALNGHGTQGLRPRGAEALDQVLSVSLERWRLGGEKARQEAAALMRACKTLGGFYLIEHGIPQRVLESGMDSCARMFRLSPEQKLSMHFRKSLIWPGTEDGSIMRGYAGLGEETLGHGEDIKESFDMSQELCLGMASPFRGPNLWPPLPAKHFQQPTEELYAYMRLVAQRLRGMISTSIGLPADCLEQFFMQDTSVMRLVNYLPGTLGSMENACQAHTDNGAFSLLHQDSEGLEVFVDCQTWVPIKPMEGALFVFVGDTLSTGTSGTLCPRMHRVRVGHARRSIIYFADPDYSASLAPICQSEASQFEAAYYGELKRARYRMYRRSAEARR